MKWTLIVADPVAAKTLLMKTGTERSWYDLDKKEDFLIIMYLLENFPKSHAVFKKLYESSPAIQFLGKENVAVSNGEVWKRQRKVVISRL